MQCFLNVFGLWLRPSCGCCFWCFSPCGLGRLRLRNFGVLALIGLFDLAQPVHSIRRNYPIIGRMRWFFEDIRPEIRQYLIEDDHEQLPFSRSQRSLVYARSKNESSERAFGTQLDVYESGYEFIGHSNRPVPPVIPPRSASTLAAAIAGNPTEHPS